MRILASPDAGATWNQKDYGQATFRDVIWTGFECGRGYERHGHALDQWAGTRVSHPWL